MRRKERQRDESFAWDVLKKAPFVTVSMIGEDGAPYSVPVNAVVDDAYRVLYFHCAKSGRKLDALRANPTVSVCAVSRAAVIPGDFTTDYTSAILRGRAEIVEDEGERVKAILLLVEELAPKYTQRLNESMDRCLPATCIVKIVPESLTGKEYTPPRGEQKCEA